MKMLLRKEFGDLVPVTSVDIEIIGNMKNGTLVWVDLRKVRNPRFVAKYFKLLDLVWCNVDHGRYPTVESLHNAIKIMTGIREEVFLPDGTVYFIPGSISFGKMKETEFEVMFSRTCDIICKDFLPDMTKETLRAEVCRMVGVPVDMVA